jgi:hypothetical protein
MYRNRIALLAALASVPIGLAACSSGSHTSGAPLVGKPAASNAGAPAGNSTGTIPQQSSSAASDAASGGAGGGGGDADAYCKFASSDTLLSHLGTNPDSTDLQGIERDTQKAIDVAPAEIKPYLQSMLKFYQDVAAGKVDVAQSDQAALEDAVKHYVDWVSQHCAGIVGATS